MSLIPDKCIEFHEQRKVCIASEKGKIFRLNNISNYGIKKVKIDKCLKRAKAEKTCDYLMEIEIAKRVIFIELKGRDLGHALKQLYSTIIYLKGEFKNYQFDARIVGSRDAPGFINTSDYIRLEKEVRRTKGTIQRGTNNIYIESI